jgi:hypothetical protein
MQNPKAPPPTEGLARIWQKLAELDRRLSGLESYFNGGATSQVPVVDMLLPPGSQAPGSPGRLGRLVVLRTNGQLYRDDGTAWIQVG